MVYTYMTYVQVQYFLHSKLFYLHTYSTSLTEDALDFGAKLGSNLINVPDLLLQSHETIWNIIY